MVVLTNILCLKIILFNVIKSNGPGSSSGRNYRIIIIILIIKDKIETHYPKLCKKFCKESEELLYKYRTHQILKNKCAWAMFLHVHLASKTYFLELYLCS